MTDDVITSKDLVNRVKEHFQRTGCAGIYPLGQDIIAEIERLIGEVLRLKALAGVRGTMLASEVETGSAQTGNPSNLALQKGAEVLWERQFKDTPWEGKVGLIRPDSMEEYRALAFQVWRAVRGESNG